MAVPIFPPTRDADLLAWSANFSRQINALTLQIGLTAAQAASYTSLHDAYAIAYVTATNPTTNSRQAVIAKNAAREELINGTGGAWELVRIVQAFPGTTDTLRGELGLRIRRDDQAHVQPPAKAPILKVVSNMGRHVKMRLRDVRNPERRGKPDNAVGATVLYFVGDAPPSDPSAWCFAMNASRPVFDAEMPASVAAGSRVWLTAFWFNARMEPSPAATPASVRVNDGVALAA